MLHELPMGYGNRYNLRDIVKRQVSSYYNQAIKIKRNYSISFWKP